MSDSEETPREDWEWKDMKINPWYGPEQEKAVKLENAHIEPAWKEAGTKPGIQIWRIVKIRPTYWPKEEYGSFYSGDAYIILNTYQQQDNDELGQDIYFWVGATALDECYETAVYKSVELNALLDDKAGIHREVMDNESPQFLKLFPSMTKLMGSGDKGYRRVDPTEYEPRLLHLHGSRTRVDVRDVPMSKNNLDDSDVFILDAGRKIYQWNGTTANKDERFTAMQFMCQLKSARFGKSKSEVCDASYISANHIFMRSLNDDPSSGWDWDAERVVKGERTMFKMTSDKGRLSFNKIADELKKDKLDSSGVFILDSTKDVFVYLGSSCSQEDTRNALSYGHNYLQKSPNPLLPVAVVHEGQDTPRFEKAFEIPPPPQQEED